MRQIEGNAKEELASATTGRILGEHFVADRLSHRRAAAVWLIG